jgi:hypothetical protein
MTIRTSDLIKAVGYLTIYWGYLELEVDTLMRFAGSICPMPQRNGAPISLNDFMERPFRNRVEYLKRRLLDRCDAVQPYPDLMRQRSSTDRMLSACLDAADERNSIMHSAIYSVTGIGTVKRERTSGSEKPVRPEEICDLANRVYNLGGRMMDLQVVAHHLMNAPLR